MTEISDRFHLNQLNGCTIVPLLTPFHEDGSLDEKALSKMTDSILGGGCKCILVSGTTGEALSMSVDLRIRLMELTIKSMNGRGLLLFGISDNCFENSATLAEAGIEGGCAGVVAHLPFCYPMGEREMENWFLALADRINGPLFIYNIPQTTGISIPMGVIERLSRHPNIAGMKDSERDMERQLDLTHLFSKRDDFAFFTGYIGESKKIMQAGARGFVPAVANVCPSLASEIMNAHLVGDYSIFDERLQRMMDIAAVFQAGCTIAEALCSMKASASVFDLCKPHVLPPLPPIDPGKIQKFRRAFEELNLINPQPSF